MNGGMDLDSYSIEQLSQLKQQEESKLNQVTQHYSQLKQAQIRFMSSKDTLGELKDDKSVEGKEVMVPLTQSLYVSGKIRDPHKVIIELGTGFYVQQSISKSQNFLDRKIALIGKNADSIYDVVMSSRKNLEAIVMTMQGKMAEVQARS
jgi:prefoldin alpha subunit